MHIEYIQFRKASIHHLVYICNDCSWLVVVVVKGLAVHSFSCDAIVSAARQDSDVSFYWLHPIQAWEFLRGLKIHVLALKNDGDALGALYWDTAFQFGSTHILWDRGRAQRRIDANVVHGNVAFLALYTGFCIRENQVFTNFNMDADADIIMYGIGNVFWTELVSMERNFIKRIICCSTFGYGNRQNSPFTIFRCRK